MASAAKTYLCRKHDPNRAVSLFKAIDDTSLSASHRAAPCRCLLLLRRRVPPREGSRRLPLRRAELGRGRPQRPPLPIWRRLPVVDSWGARPAHTLNAALCNGDARRSRLPRRLRRRAELHERAESRPAPAPDDADKLGGDGGGPVVGAAGSLCRTGGRSERRRQPRRAGDSGPGEPRRRAAPRVGRRSRGTAAAASRDSRPRRAWDGGRGERGRRALRRAGAGGGGEQRRRATPSGGQGCGARGPVVAASGERRAAPRGGRRPRRAEAAGRTAWGTTAASGGLQPRRAEVAGYAERRMAVAASASSSCSRAPSVPGCRVGMEEMGCVGPTIGQPNGVAKFG
ncbi:hypothetical protein DAI22_02g250601 [Oryza sativa Japonica Group]|nr:hypothetical protein DAI22_02g250601 [Oryza sativa Japonica Group]